MWSVALESIIQLVEVRCLEQDKPQPMLLELLGDSVVFSAELILDTRNSVPIT